MFQETRTLAPKRVLYIDRPFHAEGPDGGPMGAWTALEEFVEANHLQGRTTFGVGAMLDRMDTKPADKIRYRAAYMIPDNNPLPTNSETHEGKTEGGKFAVFLYRGGFEGLGEAWGRVMEKEFPATGLALRDAPSFEIYLDDPSSTAEDQLRTEIFIPVL